MYFPIAQGLVVMLFKHYYIMYNKLIAKQSTINHKLPLQNQTILIKLIYCDKSTRNVLLKCRSMLANTNDQNSAPFKLQKSTENSTL